SGTPLRDHHHFPTRRSSDLDVVGKPDVVRPVRLLEPFHFRDDVLGAAHVIALPPDRLGAPVAVVGAAPRGDHVHGEKTVALPPDLPVAGHVYQIPGGKGQRIQIADVGAAGCAHGLPRAVPVGEALYTGRVEGRPSFET